ncbi:DUF3820 family protein [bacterium]|nr:DUF3820 family protein [candidate division CSSED10-310 bacterium]
MLIELATTRMPFGRYKGRLLVDLPEPYLVWFRQRGFPDGKLGMQLASLYEIKVNGLEYLLRGILKRTPGHEETPSND